MTPQFKIKKIINVHNFSAILVTISSVQAATTFASDDFSSGDLTGGTGWSNDWSSGSVVGEVLQQQGNNPQLISRSITDLGLSTPQQGTPAGFYSIGLDYIPDFSSYNGVDSLGIRIFQSGQTQGTFAFVWKSNENGGQPTFLFQSPNGGQPDTFVISDPAWNIDASGAMTFDDFTYSIAFDNTVLGGSNAGQYTGSYQASIERSDGLSVATPVLGWISNPNPVSENQLAQLQFLNSSATTTSGFDNITITDMPQTIPEPSSTLAVLVGAAALGLRRRR